MTFLKMLQKNLSKIDNIQILKNDNSACSEQNFKQLLMIYLYFGTKFVRNFIKKLIQAWKQSLEIMLSLYRPIPVYNIIADCFQEGRY